MEGVCLLGNVCFVGGQNAYSPFFRIGTLSLDDIKAQGAQGFIVFGLGCLSIFQTFDVGGEIANIVEVYAGAST